MVALPYEHELQVQQISSPSPAQRVRGLKIQDDEYHYEKYCFAHVLCYFRFRDIGENTAWKQPNRTAAVASFK